MYNLYYKLSLIGLTIVLLGATFLIGLHLIKSSLPQAEVVTEAEQMIGDNFHFIGEAKASINSMEF